MENRSRPSSSSSSSLRWRILREAFLSRKHSPSPPHTTDSGGSGKSFEEEHISRKAFCKGFNLIIQQQSHQDIMKKQDEHKDVHVTYTLPNLNPKPSSSSLVICQRVVNNHLNLTDFDICNRYNIDNTGLVCPWPSEDVLAYYCLSHAEKFRSKRILELGAGYGLAGLVIAASTDALEVVISDGNPQVVDS